MKFKTRININGKTYRIRIIIDAPKEDAQRIMNLIQNSLMQKGMIT
jgi:hypothetical protein